MTKKERQLKALLCQTNTTAEKLIELMMWEKSHIIDTNTSFELVFSNTIRELRSRRNETVSDGFRKNRVACHVPQLRFIISKESRLAALCHPSKFRLWRKKFDK